MRHKFYIHLKTKIEPPHILPHVSSWWGGGVGPLIVLVGPVHRASEENYSQLKVRRSASLYYEQEPQIRIDEGSQIC